jgi:Conserved TM helix
MQESLTTALATAVAFIPQLVGFLLILLIGWLIARTVSKLLEKLLEKAGFDRAVERGGVKRALDRSKFDASDIVAKLVYYTLMLFVLQLAFGVFGPNPISALISGVIAFLPKLIVAIIIVVVAAAIAAAVKTLVEGTLGGLSYGKTLANVASAFILFLGIIAALNQIEVATAVTTPILIAILATVAGVVVVGAGGGLIKPMQSRWEGYLTRVEEEAPKVRQQARTAPSITDQAKAVKQQAQNAYDQTADEPAAAGTAPNAGATRL